MKNTFDYYRNVEKPNMYLCNPDETVIGFVHSENRHLVLRFNDLSELSFTAYKLDILEDIYNKLETKRLLFIEKIGWFQITNVDCLIEGNKESKTITAESHQTQLKMRGFNTEDRVYMFYNPNDPTDSNYVSSDLEAIPSVIGQLYQQLGIVYNPQMGEPEKDYKEWTITYIDPSLEFRAKGAGSDQYTPADGVDNICRSFSENKTFGYDFIINDVEKAFEVIFEFDFLYHSIKVKRLSDITIATDIYLSMSNVIESINVKENSDEIVTVLSCDGSGVDITSVNPMGKNYIVNFDYYKKVIDNNGTPEYPWMSKDLIDALDSWKTEWNRWQEHDDSRREPEPKESFSELVKLLRDAFGELTSIKDDLQTANLMVMDLQKARDLLITKDSEAKNGEAPIIVEHVDVGDVSIFDRSCYKDTCFSEEASITAYSVKPGCSISDEGVTSFSFSGDSQTGTAKSMILNLIADKRDDEGHYIPEDDCTPPLYFTDDSSQSSYCELLISAEAGVVKDANGMIVNAEAGVDKHGNVSIRGLTLNVTISTDHYVVAYTKPDLTQETVTVQNDTPYFVLNESRYKISKFADGTVCFYAFFISGFKRITSYKAITGEEGWYNIWLGEANNIQDLCDEKQEEINAITGKMEYIAELCDVQKYVMNYSRTIKGNISLYKELLNYWIEGSYSNNSFSVTDETPMDEVISIASQLMDAGAVELEKVSQPTFELSVEAINFLKIIEFSSFSEELELGRVITIEKDDKTHYRPALVAIEYDLDSSENFSLTFSTAGKLGETAMTFADLLNESTSTSRTVSANWSNLTDFSRNKSEWKSIILDPLDRTKRAMNANMASQAFIADNSGVLCCKKDTSAPGYDPDDRSTWKFDNEQIRIINNTILFTQDNWETLSTALGKVYYEEDGEEKTAYGLIAEVLVGRVLLGERLKITNSSNTISFDDDGITIYKPIAGGGRERTFQATTDGDVYVKGKIYATEIELGEDASIDYEDIDGLSSAEAGEVMCAAIECSPRPLALAGNRIAISSDNFTMTKEGLLTAQNAEISGNITAHDGNIGGFTISENCIYHTKESFSHLSDGVYLGTDGISVGKNGFSVSQDGTVDIKRGSIRIGKDGKYDQDFIEINEYGIKVGYGSDSKTELGHGIIHLYSEDVIFDKHHEMLIGMFTPTQNDAIMDQWCTFYSIQKLDIAATYGNNFNYALGAHITFEAERPDGVSYANRTESVTINAKDIYLKGNGYLGNTPIATSSDRKVKKDIHCLDEKYDTLFDLLTPSTFKYIDGTSDRVHLGFIAQEVYDAIRGSCLTTKDFAAFVKDIDKNGDEHFYIRYEEFIALNTNQIQKLKARVLALENEIKELKGE